MSEDFDFWERQYSCPICGSSQVVPAFGPTKSDVLIVGEYVGEEELKQGIPMVGNMGNVLRTELAYLKFDFKSARRTNLWRHPPNKNKDCLKNGMEEVIKEAKGRKAILLLGNEVVDLFIGKSVMKIAGVNVKSDYFSAPVIVCCPNPAMAFHAGHGIGEIRLSLTKFIRLLESVKDVMVDSNLPVSTDNVSSDPWL